MNAALTAEDNQPAKSEGSPGAEISVYNKNTPTGRNSCHGTVACYVSDLRKGARPPFPTGVGSAGQGLPINSLHSRGNQICSQLIHIDSHRRGPYTWAAT